MALLAQWVNDDLVISQIVKKSFLAPVLQTSLCFPSYRGLWNSGAGIDYLTIGILCDIYIYFNTTAARTIT